jgi:hypothetical protein
MVSAVGMGAAALFSSLAAHADPFKLAYLGDWTIVSRQMAPWALPDDTPVASDIKALMGKTVTFAPKSIRAPQPLGCNDVKYKVDTYTSDLLFEGGLTNPDRQAAALGFHDKAIPTLIPGCEIEFHFLDADTALFALNNSIYRLQRKAKNQTAN